MKYQPINLEKVVFSGEEGQFDSAKRFLNKLNEKRTISVPLEIPVGALVVSNIITLYPSIQGDILDSVVRGKRVFFEDDSAIFNIRYLFQANKGYQVLVSKYHLEESLLELMSKEIIKGDKIVETAYKMMPDKYKH